MADLLEMFTGIGLSAPAYIGYIGACTNDLIVLPLVGGIFFFFSEKNPVGSNSRPNVSEGYEVTSELPGVVFSGWQSIR